MIDDMVGFFNHDCDPIKLQSHQNFIRREGFHGKHTSELNVAETHGKLEEMRILLDPDHDRTLLDINVNHRNNHGFSALFLTLASCAGPWEAMANGASPRTRREIC
jgi:hypothetical protein